MKVLCVLYPDPKDGMPRSYYRNSLPHMSHYPDGQTLPTPQGRDFTPGTLLGSVSGKLGLEKFLKTQGHEFIVTSDKEGPNSEFDRHLIDADVVISQPFYPGYLTAERLEKAKNLKLAITAGIGSDHVDLAAANKKGITVAEVTFCNSISVAEHAVMMMLALVRDYMTQHEIARSGGWDIADCVKDSYDIEGMDVGVLAAGRIGLAVLRRMKPFDVKLHYFDRYRLDAQTEKSLNAIYHDSIESLVSSVDVLSIHCPLTAETDGLFDKTLLAKMKKGAYIVNTARGKICNKYDIKDAIESGHLAGYAGDVWYPQPAQQDHPWRTMPKNAMTPHTSGTSLSAQARYADGVREILENFFAGNPIRNEYLIVSDGDYVGTGKHSYAKKEAVNQ
ncbi:NAD-dependent formate dehydrogenase [Facilibium subflavum]|uniref:NAD-dependent formate dehydrogenase n=1 Tax=Facilibium subflavum TaxID=2219058 RepID=UPI000E64D41A|nr:NAD-dependent formate dehydrogenase [Facilibium subflavum]